MYRFCFALCVTVLAGAVGYAGQAYRPDITFGSRGTGDGEFLSISGVVVSGNRLLVVDRDLHRVQAFTLDGAYLSKFGTFGSGDNQLRFPCDVDVDGAGRIFLADAGNYRIHRRNPAYSLLNLFGTQGPAPDQFTYLQAVAADPVGGRVWTLDAASQGVPCVAAWSPSGVFQGAFGSFGADPGSFHVPVELAVDYEGNVYVSDELGNWVSRFNRNGRFVRRFNKVLGKALSDPCGMVCDRAGYLYVVDYQEALICKLTTGGTGVCLTRPPNVTWAEITSIAVDSLQRIYVSNHWSQIQRFHLNQAALAPTTLYVTPASPRDDRDLVAKPSGSTDPDGDAVTYRYRWQFSLDGGESWSNAGQTARVLPASATEPGEWWRAQARAFDGDAFSAWATSKPVSIR